MSNCLLAGALHLSAQLAFGKHVYRITVMRFECVNLGISETLRTGLIKIQYVFNCFKLFFPHKIENQEEKFDFGKIRTFNLFYIST